MLSPSAVSFLLKAWMPPSSETSTFEVLCSCANAAAAVERDSSAATVRTAIEFALDMTMLLTNGWVHVAEPTCIAARAHAHSSHQATCQSIAKRGRGRQSE